MVTTRCSIDSLWPHAAIGRHILIAVIDRRSKGMMGVGSGGTTPSQDCTDQTGQPGRPREWMPRIELRPDLRTPHHRDQHERRTRVASQTSASPPGVLRPWSCEANPSPEQPPIPHHRLRRTHPHPGKIRVRRVHDRIELQPRHHRRHHLLAPAEN